MSVPALVRRWIFVCPDGRGFLFFFDLKFSEKSAQIERVCSWSEKLYSTEVKFKMTSKLIIISNNELKFDSDEAMKRRLKQHHWKNVIFTGFF